MPTKSPIKELDITPKKVIRSEGTLYNIDESKIKKGTNESCLIFLKKPSEYSVDEIVKMIQDSVRTCHSDHLGTEIKHIIEMYTSK